MKGATPTKVGVHCAAARWIPAFAGMANLFHPDESRGPWCSGAMDTGVRRYGAFWGALKKIVFHRVVVSLP